MFLDKLNRFKQVRGVMVSFAGAEILLRRSVTRGDLYRRGSDRPRRLHIDALVADQIGALQIEAVFLLSRNQHPRFRFPAVAIGNVGRHAVRGMMGAVKILRDCCRVACQNPVERRMDLSQIVLRVQAPRNTGLIGNHNNGNAEVVQFANRKSTAGYELKLVGGREKIHIDIDRPIPVDKHGEL